MNDLDGGEYCNSSRESFLYDSSLATVPDFTLQQTFSAMLVPECRSCMLAAAQKMTLLVS